MLFKVHLCQCHYTYLLYKSTPAIWTIVYSLFIIPVVYTKDNAALTYLVFVSQKGSYCSVSDGQCSLCTRHG